MNNISIFCERKGLPKRIEQAFITYCKDLYASRYQMKSSGDTVTQFVSNLTDQQIQDAWNNFILDLKNVIPTEVVSPS